MVWVYDADGRKENTEENVTHKNGGKTIKRKTRIRCIDQIRKDIETGGENCKERQENRKWNNRDGWRFL